MKNVLTLLTCFGIVVFTCGFVESSRIIKIRKDGSGEILVRVLYNPTSLEEGEKSHDPEALKKVPYGKGVEYVVSTPCKIEKTGWVGYLAKYKFSDIDDVRIFPASLPRAATVGPDDVLYKSGWRFSTGKEKAAAEGEDGEEGDGLEEEEPAPAPAPAEAPVAADGTFKLEVIPIYEDFKVEGEGDFGEEEFGEEEALVDVGEEDLTMKALQSGRRYVTYLKFEDDIDKEASTVAKDYYSKVEANTVVLNDEQFDIMWSKPSARERILQEEPDFAGYGIQPAETNGYRTTMKKTTIVLK